MESHKYQQTYISGCAHNHTYTCLYVYTDMFECYMIMAISIFINRTVNIRIFSIIIVCIHIIIHIFICFILLIVLNGI